MKLRELINKKFKANILSFRATSQFSILLDPHFVYSMLDMAQ